MGPFSMFYGLFVSLLDGAGAGGIMLSGYVTGFPLTCTFRIFNFGYRFICYYTNILLLSAFDIYHSIH